MKIGIDASRAFLKNRTGIEEYSYQTIKNLRDHLKDHQVVLYLRKNQYIDFELPEKWETKVISWHRFWTQLGLSLKMLFHPVEVLFVPAHTVPFIHPKKTIVTIHGLEYEFCPKAYSFWARICMRFFIKNSCKWASEIIAVSENTKKDLMALYNVPEKKIDVIYEGYSFLCHSELVSESQPLIRNISAVQEILKQVQDDRLKYLLFIGRIEERKNIKNIIDTFEILKEKYKIPHKLILAGKKGYGYEKIKFQISKFKFREDLIEVGYISEEEKWQLLKNADCFVFPTQYEGFGIPILEAQSVGCPVIASNNSSIPEVTDNSAVLVDPEKAEEIAEAVHLLLSDETLKNDIIAKGLDNVRRFSWKKCSAGIAKLLNS